MRNSYHPFTRPFYRHITTQLSTAASSKSRYKVSVNPTPIRTKISGNIIDAGFDDTGVAKYALLRPAADFSSLEQVFIITSYTVG